MPGVTIDLDGRPRPIGPAADIGTYERPLYVGGVYLPLALRS